VELGPGEHVLFEGHPSWRSTLGFYLKGLLLALVVGVVVYLATDDELWTGLAAFFVFDLVGTIGLLKRLATTYKVSDRRLWIRRGLLSRAVQETRLDRVQNVNTEQSFLDRILRIGTVDFDTAAGDDYDFSFEGVADPEGISRQVDRALRGEVTSSA
jgi:uncharacterized membrane protein YdbT with pleckstrin-like domain